jgi:hypothetical protein
MLKFYIISLWELLLERYAMGPLMCSDISYHHVEHVTKLLVTRISII